MSVKGHVCGRIVSELRQAYQAGELSRITHPGEVAVLLDQLMSLGWVVYTKPWLRDPQTVLEYLARSSHRTAISDARIGTIREEEVAVRYKDYRDNDRWKTMHLPGEELIRWFLLHVLHKGLMRVRHYGFLANRCRKAKLAQIREVFGQPLVEEPDDEPALVPSRDCPCPSCRQGRLQVQWSIAPIRLSGA